MKILIQQYLGQNHSWSVTGQGIARQLIKQGHNTHLISTNGIKLFPNDLKDNLIGYREENQSEYRGRNIDNDYDMVLSYTAPKNFQRYLSNGNKNRFGIWTFEFYADSNPLPDGFAKGFNNTDLVLPPSNFVKQIFLNAGVSDNKLVLVPHGIDQDQFDDVIPYQLKTKKSCKIFINCGQPHIRKNIESNLEAFGRAFSKKDDICLVIKMIDKIPTQPFEVSFKKLFNAFKDKFKDHAEVEIIREFVPNIASIYKACDIYISLTRGEGFGLTFLEGLAAKNIVIASKYSGQLDFLNDNNSFLINGQEIPAPPNALYWQNNKYHLKYFNPNLDEATEALRHCYNNLSSLKQKMANYTIPQQYHWSSVAKQIIGLCK